MVVFTDCLTYFCQQIPQFEFLSNAKPSLYAYPPAIKPPTTTVVEKVATAVLSTTAKTKARAKKNEKGDLMDVVSFCFGRIPAIHGK